MGVFDALKQGSLVNWIQRSVENLPHDLSLFVYGYLPEAGTDSPQRFTLLGLAWRLISIHYLTLRSTYSINLEIPRTPLPHSVGCVQDPLYQVQIQAGLYSKGAYVRSIKRVNPSMH